LSHRFSLLVVVFLCLPITYSDLSDASEVKDIHLEPAPDWVIQYDVGAIDDVPTDEVSNGLHYHMVDNQIQITKTGERTSYNRYVETIVNQSGLDSSSQLNFKFDPSYQKFALNSLYILRDGQRIDRLQSAKKSLLNTESELKSQIYSGSMTLNVLMSDLQVGDTLDYSYTRYGANPVYRNSFSYSRSTNWGVPLNIQHLRILWGKSNPLFVTPINDNTKISKSKMGEFTEYQITQLKPEMVNTPSQMPAWYDAYSSVYFSESENWSDVVAWAKPLYQFKIHTSVKKVADDIQSQYPDTSSQIVAALKYAQENIRYVGLEMGENSHVPTAPEETLRLKYGDCKDKASLLIAILAAMDIEAFPALVDTEYTKLLQHRPPAANLFNHVIVSLNYQGEQIWLDPTLINQTGSLTNLYQPDYGYALILKPAENSLTSMSSSTDDSYTHITEKYYIPEKHEQKVTLSVVTQHSGENVLNILARLEKEGKKKVANNYEIYYQKSFPSLVSAGEMVVSIDDKEGTVAINEEYEIAEYWSKGDEHYEADYYPTEVRDAVFKPDQVKRTAPFALAFPNNINNHFDITFESDGWEFDDEEFVEENPFFSFHKTVSFEANTLSLKFDYRTKVDHVAADQIVDYLAARERLRDEAYFGLLKYIKSDVSDNQVAVVDEKPYSALQIIIAIYAFGLLFILMSWIVESRKRVEFADTHFYPMSGLKFLILGVGTMGLYDIYWTYRNWHAVKLKNNTDIMPVARGIFSPIWFYPLFSALRKDSLERFDKNKVMFPFIALIFAAAYLTITFASSYSEHVLVSVLGLTTPLLFMPFVLYINSINNKSDGAYKYNSKWRIRQVVALILCVPLVAYTLALETPFLPGDSVRTESQMLDGDLKFLYRKQVLPANETIQYFYSDAFLSIRDDGNGFTNERVFSYWLDDSEGFQLEVASFDQVKNIEVEYAENKDSNTIITIKRQDSTEFMLFVSTVDGGDKLFFNLLNSLWKKKK
jgi:transglutaminase-like putative cysteine protease